MGQTVLQNEVVTYIRMLNQLTQLNNISLELKLLETTI